MTLPLLLENIAASHPDNTAQLSKDREGTFHPRSWRDLLTEVDAFAAGLVELGVSRGDHVGLISENRAEWLVCDLATMSLGAADVPRGNDTTPQELRFILGYADVAVVAVENQAQLDKLAGIADELPQFKTAIVLAPPLDTPLSTPQEIRGHTVTTYDEVVNRGREALIRDSQKIRGERAKGDGEDVATIIFTSGTTGEPKGVMLTHTNFLHQVQNVPLLLNVGPMMCGWRCYRCGTALNVSCSTLRWGSLALAYSKPVGNIMLADFQKVRPTWMASVPRIWEAIRGGNLSQHSQAERGDTRTILFLRGRWGTVGAPQEYVLWPLPRFHKRNRFLDACVAAIPLLLLTRLSSWVTCSSLRRSVHGWVGASWREYPGEGRFQP